MLQENTRTIINVREGGRRQYIVRHHPHQNFCKDIDKYSGKLINFYPPLVQDN
jgi:hypothetical protein